MYNYPKDVWSYFIHHPSDYIGWFHFHLNTVVNLIMHFLLWSALLFSCGALRTNRLFNQLWFILLISQIPVMLFFSIIMNFYASRFMLPAYPIITLALVLGYQSYWDCSFQIKKWLPYLLALPLLLCLIFVTNLVKLKHANFEPISVAAFILMISSFISCLALLKNPDRRNCAFILATSSSCLLSVVVH